MILIYANCILFSSSNCISFLQLILIIHCISFHCILYISFYAFHFIHLILCIWSHASHYMHLIICISFNASHLMHLILYISFYIFHSIHLFICILFYFDLLNYCWNSLENDRPTDGWTDIATYRAAIIRLGNNVGS